MELILLYESYPAESIRAYAVGLELLRRHNHRVSAHLADKICECMSCNSETMQPHSPAYLYRMQQLWCDACQKNVRVRIVDRHETRKEERIHREEKAVNFLLKGGSWERALQIMDADEEEKSGHLPVPARFKEQKIRTGICV